MRKHEKARAALQRMVNICVHCQYEFAVKCSLLSATLMRTKHCRRNCEEMSSKLEIGRAHV